LKCVVVVRNLKIIELLVARRTSGILDNHSRFPHMIISSVHCKRFPEVSRWAQIHPRAAGSSWIYECGQNQETVVSSFERASSPATTKERAMQHGRKTNINRHQKRPLPGRAQQRPPSVLRPNLQDSHNARRNYDRYIALAQAELQAGDRVAAENYFQHAEHYFRISSNGGTT